MFAFWFRTCQRFYRKIEEIAKYRQFSSEKEHFFLEEFLYDELDDCTFIRTLKAHIRRFEKKFSSQNLTNFLLSLTRMETSGGLKSPL